VSEPIKLLFVDDEEDFVEYMSMRLRRHDLDVEGYTNPKKALKETKGRTFDVALLDLKMPEMDGEDVMRELKKRDPHLQFIILTGHGSIESAFRTGQMGGHEYLLKPCDFDGLVRSITNAYAKRIKALQAEMAPQVDNLMMKALGMSPLGLLKELKKINDGLTDTMVASTFAESGEYETARDLIGEKQKKNKKKDKEDE
jgi:DNA-binding NtrC family response regulator